MPAGLFCLRGVREDGERCNVQGFRQMEKERISKGQRPSLYKRWKVGTEATDFCPSKSQYVKKSLPRVMIRQDGEYEIKQTQYTDCPTGYYCSSGACIKIPVVTPKQPAAMMLMAIIYTRRAMYDYRLLASKRVALLLR